MDIKHITQSNRKAWNQATDYHQKARRNALYEGFKDPNFTTLNRDCDDVLHAKLQSIGLTGKSIAQLPCNNGRELLSLMRLGAKNGVGFDISDAAIHEARKLAEIAGCNAIFERTNILEIGSGYDNAFDFIYISEGSLQWFPDLKAYFSIVFRLLKPGGRILIFEIHPFAYLFDHGFDPNVPSLDDLGSYFDAGPYHYHDGLDYVGGTLYPSEECYWFMHTTSGILNAILNSGIELLEIEEYNLEMANDAAVQAMDKFPLSYIIVGRKT